MFNPKKLGDVLRLHRGYDITKAQQSPGPYPVVSSSGVASFHSNYKFKGPGVVIGRKGSLGTVFYLTGRYWPHDTTLYVEDFRGNDPRYCYYLLKTLALERYDVGASNPTLNRNHLHELDVRVPSPVVQERIASILSAYDDLIENNTRRIAILEEMARRIFEEWFLHFRTPGCEGLPMVDSPLGLIPQGWGVKPIGEVFEVTGGGTPSKAEPSFWEHGTINWFTPSDLTGSGTHFLDASSLQITDLGLQKSSARIFPAFCVMMTSRATLGVFSINTTMATTNQGFITCLPNASMPLNYLYFWLRQNAAEFERHASGATFKEITKGTFKKLPIALPPADLRQLFDQTVRPTLGLVLNLERQNRNLRAQRDLLLPKLISGEIDLSAAAPLQQEAAE